MTRTALTLAAIIPAAVAIAVVAVLAKPDVQISVAGPATIQDGDSILVNNRRVRLYGIDAPELDQTCTNAAGSPWLCGIDAKVTLTRLIAGDPVTCIQEDTDRYFRIVAICMARQIDLGRAMVRLGMAVAYRRYSVRYVPDEDAARLAKLGLWSGTFVAPADWRRNRRGVR